MNIDRRYQCTACLAVALAMATYATAAGWALLAIVAIPLVVVLWRLSSAPAGATPALLLPRWMVNLLLAASLAYAAWRTTVRGPDVEGVAELVILLQLIKLGDRRSARDDAQILALAVFLAIAGMLTSNVVWVGLLLAAFLPALTFAIMLHQLRAGVERVRLAGAALEPGAPSIAVRPIAGRRLRQHLRSVGVLALACALATAVFVFVLMPRGIGENQFGRWGTASRQQTGFSDQVELGSGGVISESQQVVLDLQIQTQAGENLGAPDTLHYLRGAVLDQYQGGVWMREGAARDQRRMWREVREEQPLAFEPQVPGLVVQLIRFRSLGPEPGQPLLHLWRPVRIEFTTPGRVQLYDGDGTRGWRTRTGRIAATDARMAQGFEYMVASTTRPGPEPEERRAATPLSNQRINELAAQVVVAAGLNPDPVTRPVREDRLVAEAIESHLRSEYRYTLVEHRAPQGLDPMEYFLFTTREGHCEYFAAAMTALCRAVGINARMAVGYLAAEYNPSAETYTVRESNAHAWVEAELGTDAWQRFDPTPSEDLVRIHRPNLGALARIRQWIDALEFLWNSRVVSFDERARERVIGRGPDGGGGGVLGGLDRFIQRIRAGGPRLVRDAALGAVLVFVGAAVIGALAVLGARSARWSPRWPWRRTGRAPAVQALADPALAARLEKVRFYDALLRALDRRGHPKPAWRPPLDHAAAVALVDPALGGAAADLSGLYYRVRFGAGDITEPERRHAEDALARLAAEPSA